MPDWADIAAAPPWPQAARELALDPAAWRAAEPGQIRALLPAAEARARLGERLRHLPAGLDRRLALGSVVALLRAEGHWLGPERIALVLALRLAPGPEARALRRAGWALRRLVPAGGGAAAQPGADLHRFLGRDARRSGPDPAPGGADPDAIGLERGLSGADLRAAGAEWAAGLAALADLHPLTRAAWALAAWRAAGITAPEDMLEPAVAAMLLGAGPGSGPGAGSGLAFLPWSAPVRLDRVSLAAGPGAALAEFADQARAGALAALMELDRVAAWRHRAEAALGPRRGGVALRLLAALAAHPVLPADRAADLAGCSPAAARRNLARLAAAGLVRETTGQDRYRFWAAAL